MNILASALRPGDIVLGYGAQDIKITSLHVDGNVICVNPGSMHHMLVLPADRQVSVIRPA